MADDSQRLKTIADGIQATYEALRKAAANISGLLQVGKATCDEVKAYNVYALMIWNTQRGMLTTLRANGQNVPEAPPAPTLFTWKGTAGADAWKLSCDGQPSSLSGLMGRALKGPKPSTQYLSTNDIDISTSDQYAFNPEAAPSYKMLLDLQQLRQQEQQQQMAGLGIAPVVVILIVAISVVIAGIAISAIMKYLETSSIQEANIKETQAQADAFAAYTAARLSCYSQCVQGGKDDATCIELCKKLVDKPHITIPGQNKPWGMLQWIGFTVVTGTGAIIAWHLWRRHQEGKPLLELPELPDSASDAFHSVTTAA